MTTTVITIFLGGLRIRFLDGKYVGFKQISSDPLIDLRISALESKENDGASICATMMGFRNSVGIHYPKKSISATVLVVFHVYLSFPNIQQR